MIMRDAALQVPFSVCQMVPVIHVFIQELGLCVVHAIKAKTIEVAPDPADCVAHDNAPVSTTPGTSFVRFRWDEVSLEGLKVLADLADRFAALLIDGISTSRRKRLEVLEDSLLLALALSKQHFAQGLPKPSS